MDFIIENIRLRELVLIVEENRLFFDDFCQFLLAKGYMDLHEFVNEDDPDRALETIAAYLNADSGVRLFNGMGEAYRNSQARWMFLSWMFRDAPAQRLAPLVRTMPGSSILERRAHLLNRLREDVRALFPDPDSWKWPALSEVLIARLEGSRRSLRGTLFESIVRRCLSDLFERSHIDLKIGDGQVRIFEETYDVAVYGVNETVLLPVKTRETTGGGHAVLFTRDIEKAITVAEDAGYRCLPIVVAESWGGNLEALASRHFIYLQINPNQISRVVPMLTEKLEGLIDFFREVS